MAPVKNNNLSARVVPVDAVAIAVTARGDPFKAVVPSAIKEVIVKIWSPTLEPNVQFTEALPSVSVITVAVETEPSVMAK